MENHIKKHIDELYETGKTVFMDVYGEYDDVVVEFESLAASWALGHNDLFVNFMKRLREDNIYIMFSMAGSANEHIRLQIKQLCIDYYGDE